MRLGKIYFLLLAFSPFLAASGDYASAYTILVSAPNRDYREVPVSVSIVPPGPFSSVSLQQIQPKANIPCQVEREGKKIKVTWIVRGLNRGTTRRYQLFFKKGKQPKAKGIEVRRAGGEVEVAIEGKLFTRYCFADTPKPYCYPIISRSGKAITRGYPMEKIPGESSDHPHHRSFWFAHGEVNGFDFWSESPKAGKIVHRSFEALEGGPVFGRIRARNEWVSPEGKKVCEEVRELRVYNFSQGNLLDLEITLFATEGWLTFGDTKEGTMALRVADSISLTRGQGHIENSRGNKDKEAWGKRAEWCDYYGPVEGETLGIAVFDHPSNFRHPTYWHVRDYGLFAANPFGLHDFEGKPERIGDYTLKAGESITFRYRMFIHGGTAEGAKVKEVYGEYAEPPVIRVIETAEEVK